MSIRRPNENRAQGLEEAGIAPSKAREGEPTAAEGENSTGAKFRLRLSHQVMYIASRPWASKP